jgi:uncharacterized OB-fold protein
MYVQESFIEEQKVGQKYSWTTGEVYGRFLTELRDNRKIMGIKCPWCLDVIVPPQKVCGRCLKKTEEWVELGPRGRVKTYALITQDQPDQKIKPPYVVALIRLDGADTEFLHLLGDVKYEEVYLDMEVEAVWKAEREGHILDILHFKPVGG